MCHDHWPLTSVEGRGRSVGLRPTAREGVDAEWFRRVGAWGSSGGGQ